jgi:PDZ domain-containing protein
MVMRHWLPWWLDAPCAVSQAAGPGKVMMFATTERSALTMWGIPVRLHPSLVLIAGLAVWSTSTQLRPVAGSMAVAVVMAAVATIGMFASILWHELAHARQGRRHDLHVHGVTLFVFGGVTAMDDRIASPGDEFRIAAVGPWVSLQLAAAFGLVTAGLDWMAWAPRVAAVLGLLGWFNLSLGMFNLLPGAPLDGGRVLQAVLWRLLGDRRRAARGSALVGIALGLALWGLSAWLVSGNSDVLWSALWLTAVAAFIFALAVRHWRQWGRQPALPEPGDAAGALPEPAATPAATTQVAGAAAATAAPPVAVATPRRRSGWQWAGLVASVVLVLAGFGVVPMPFVELSPGPLFDVEDHLEVSGPTTEVSGDAVMLTVQTRRPGMAEVLRAWVVEDRRLEPRNDVIPPSVGDRAWFGEQRDTFRASFDMAVAAGLRAAGEEVSMSIRVVVRTVLAGAPADGIVAPGDMIVAADGQPLRSLEQLSQLTFDKDEGDPLDLRIQRDGETLDVTVPIGLLPGGERTGIGVTLGTTMAEVDLPRTVTTDIGGIGGPSAGLVTALTVHDIVSEVDVLAGRVVAATATTDAQGRLGRVGSIREKMLGAIDRGADLVLVHESQVSDALQATRGRVEVVGVTTLDEAIDHLVG